MSALTMNLASEINLQTNSWDKKTLDIIDGKLITDKFKQMWEILLLLDMLPKFKLFLIKKHNNKQLFNQLQKEYLFRLTSIMVTFKIKIIYEK